MPQFRNILTSFSGRIPRSSWWLGFATIVASLILAALIIDPGVWTASSPRAPSRLLALVFLGLVVPMTAVSVKRFNDRNRPVWVGYAMGAIGAGLIIGEQLGFMLEPETATLLERGTFWLAAAVLFLAFIDNGILRGTPGPNRHGPDPLAPREHPSP